MFSCSSSQATEIEIEKPVVNEMDISGNRVFGNLNVKAIIKTFIIFKLLEK